MGLGGWGLKSEIRSLMFWVFGFFLDCFWVVFGFGVEFGVWLGRGALV